MEEEIPGSILDNMFTKGKNDPPPGRIQPGLISFKGRPYDVIISFLLLCNITLILINIGIWVMAAIQDLIITADFTSFYTGYYLVRIGQGAELYNAPLQSAYQQQFMGGSITFAGGVLLFPNPPFVALILSPLSFLSLHVAYYVWTVFQLVILILVLWYFTRLFPSWSDKERILSITAVLAFWPVINNLLLGQFSLLLMLGIIQLYIGMKNAKPLSSALGFFLLAIKPQAMLLPGIMTLNKRYWLHALAGAVVGIFLFGLSALALGLKPWVDFLRSLQTLSSYFGEYGVTPKNEYTVRGILANLLGNSQGSLTNLISFAVLIAGVLFVWVLWSRNIAPTDRKFNLYFAITITLSVFLSMHLNPHDALALVFPAALFYDYLKQNHLPTEAYSIIILGGPLIFFISAFTNVNLFTIFRPPVILIMIVLGWMIRYLIVELRQKQAISS